MMYLSTQHHSSSGSRHISALSQDTTASGIADSTISNGDSLRLSQFPQPPASIPSTPILSEFTSTSPIRSTFTNRMAKRKMPPPVPGPSDDSSNVVLEDSSSVSMTMTPRSHPLSPYDWHDGASSIGMDATEDRLLSTSFITSLLQENAHKRENHRVSDNSDALSGFSEMTYPPPSSIYSDRYATSSATRTLPQRPQGRQQPPTSFPPIYESTSRLSGDSDTLYSTRDNHTSAVRKASVSRGQGATVVGVAPAMLQSVSTKHNTSYHHSDDDHPLKSNFSSEGVSLMCRATRNDPLTPQTRESMHSTRSAVPSFISRISLPHSIRRIFAWKSTKPLPPVPRIPHIPIATEIEHRRADESKTLPDLVNRADTLQGLLEKGYHPHHSLNSYYGAQKGEALTSGFDDDTVARATTFTGSSQSSPVRRYPPNGPNRWPKPLNSSLLKSNASPKTRRLFILSGVFLIVVLATLGIAIGVTVGRKKATTVVCPNGFAGTACDLNSTCVCTSLSSGTCDGLAQNIVDLIPSVNQYFLTNLTSNSVYNKIHLVQGAVSGNCDTQSVLVDVAPALNIQTFPNITLWAQTSLLWNLLESQDLIATATLRKFIQKAPWISLNTNNNTSPFSTTVSGYTFNFATQEVTQPSVSFVAVGQPTADQLSRVGTVAHTALDRMYSFAQAASTQHQKALEIYWTTVLQQQVADLSTFVSAFSVSPVLLPFDATSSQQPQSVSQLLSTSTSAPFPPPLACYPALNTSQVQLVNAVEDNVFGLSPISSASLFDPACYPDRPIYGVLDVLRLRLPFSDSQSGIPSQAAVLTRDVAPRVLLHNGAILSTLPGPSNVTGITTQLTDPRNFGTLGQLDHVILQYLSSIPDVNVAIALVAYILSSASTLVAPPTNTSILFQSLDTIPVIEVSVFGSIIPSDIESAISSFTASSGSLFFGSNQGTALRNWAITGCGSSIAWTESVLSPLIVRDSSFSDQIFNETWMAVSLALQDNIQNIGLANVTESFSFNNRFTSS